MKPSIADWPAVSIIIITKDRREDLDRCLESLRQVDYPGERLQIVIVEECDQPRDPGNVDYVVIPRENRGWGYARNIGIRHARHNLFVFTDDDCLFETNWLKELVSPLEGDIAGVSGGVLVKDANAVGCSEIVLGFPNGGLLRIHAAQGHIVDTTGMSTCNCLYKRAVFDRMGGFVDTRNTRGEDMEFAQRAVREFRFVFNPDAIVYHKPRGSLAKVFKWFVERGKSQFMISDYLKDRRRHLLYNLQNSMSLRLLLIVGLLAALGPWRWPVLMLLIPAYYLFILKRFAFQHHYLKRTDSLLMTPIVKIVMDVGMEIGRLLQVRHNLVTQIRRTGKRPEEVAQ